MSGVVVQNIERADLDGGRRPRRLRRRHGARGAGPHRAARQLHAADLSGRADRRRPRSRSACRPATTGWSTSRSSSAATATSWSSRRPARARTAISATCSPLSAQARGVRGLVIDAGVRDVRDLTEMGFPVWSKADLRARHDQGDARQRQRAGGLRRRLHRAGRRDRRRRRRRLRGPARRCGRRCSRRRAAREANEGDKRQRLAAGELGLDMYGMRAEARRHGPEVCLSAARPLHVDARRDVEGRLFPRRDLPADTAARDAFLLARDGLARSAPDRRHGRRRSADQQGRGRAASPSAPGIDVDYLFLQVFVDQAIVTDAQNCGNILAGVGPFAIERGLVARDRTARRGSRIFMENTGQVAIATVADARRRGRPMRATRGSTACPARHAPVPLEFRDTAGSSLRRAAADRQRGGRDRRRRAAR